jgi:hypothetical protein
MLEDRTVPTIILPPPGTAGLVQMIGTPGADNFLVRLLPNQTPTLALSDNGGSTFKIITLDRVIGISVTGEGGNDNLTIDNGVGFIANLNGLPITFNAGAGTSQLIVQSQALTKVVETYAPSALGMTLNSSHVSAGQTMSQTIYLNHVTGVTDSVPASSLLLKTSSESGPPPVRPATNDSYQIANGAPLPGGGRTGGTLATVTVQEIDAGAGVGISFTPITFTNKTNVSTEFGDYDDNTVTMNCTANPTGLQSFYLDGGQSSNNALVIVNMPSNMNCTWDNFQTVIWINPGGGGGGGSGGSGGGAVAAPAATGAPAVTFVGAVSSGSSAAFDALPTGMVPPITEV